MGMNVAQKLIKAHLVSGEMTPGREIGLRIDQTLTQDATGTLVMLELEAMELDRVRTQASVQYVDHNLLTSIVPDTQVEPTCRVTVTIMHNGTPVYVTSWLIVQSS